MAWSPPRSPNALAHHRPGSRGGRRRGRCRRRWRLPLCFADASSRCGSGRRRGTPPCCLYLRLGRRRRHGCCRRQRRHLCGERVDAVGKGSGGGQNGRANSVGNGFLGGLGFASLALLYPHHPPVQGCTRHPCQGWRNQRQKRLPQVPVPPEAAAQPLGSDGRPWPIGDRGDERAKGTHRRRGGWRREGGGVARWTPAGGGGGSGS